VALSPNLQEGTNVQASIVVTQINDLVYRIQQNPTWKDDSGTPTPYKYD
jgi:hypothetical protein